MCAVTGTIIQLSPVHCFFASYLDIQVINILHVSHILHLFYTKSHLAISSTLWYTDVIFLTQVLWMIIIHDISSSCLHASSPVFHVLMCNLTTILVHLPIFKLHDKNDSEGRTKHQQKFQPAFLYVC